MLAADINIHCEPTPTWCPGEDEETLFSVAPGHRIIVMTLRGTQDNIFNSDSYTIVVLFRDLMSHLEPRDPSGSSRTLETPWSEWGEKTRLFYPTSAHGCSDLLSVYGTRFISIPMERSATMEIIDFNPHIIQRRLSAKIEVSAKKSDESVYSPTPGHGETAAKDWGNKVAPGSAGILGDGEVILGDETGATSGEQENRSRIVTDTPSQLPGWIPVEAALNCSLPYTSYEIQIPSYLNMDFCIDVMMGQDTIVFMFVCHAFSAPASV